MIDCDRRNASPVVDSRVEIGAINLRVQVWRHLHVHVGQDYPRHCHSPQKVVMLRRQNSFHLRSGLWRKVLHYYFLDVPVFFVDSFYCKKRIHHLLRSFADANQESRRHWNPQFARTFESLHPDLWVLARCVFVRHAGSHEPFA